MQKRFRGVDGVLCGKISFSDSGNFAYWIYQEKRKETKKWQNYISDMVQWEAQKLQTR